MLARHLMLIDVTNWKLSVQRMRERFTRVTKINIIKITIIKTCNCRKYSYSTYTNHTL